MDKSVLRKLLEKLQQGELTVAEALARLRHFPFENLEFARVDHHRTLRQGTPEVIYAPGKTDRQIIQISKSISGVGARVLITRLDKKRVTVLKKSLARLQYFPEARMGILLPGRKKTPEISFKTPVLICTAGTSDIPVAEEAAVTAWAMGCPVEKIYDVGVAGIHRLLAHKAKLTRAGIIIAVAGMEGALPSVIGGLAECPVIAVPTSVGYGASFGGLTALLSMLNTCASGVTVVNIDNGFGAAMAAIRIIRLKEGS